jgi:hypothetical protein
MRRVRDRVEAEKTQMRMWDFAIEINSLQRRRRDCEARIKELDGMLRATLAAVREHVKRHPPFGFCGVCQQVVPYALDGPRIFKPHRHRGKPCRANGEESEHHKWVETFHPKNRALGPVEFFSKGGWR